MLRKLMKMAGVAVVVAVLGYLVADRPLSELFGYSRAAADRTIDRLTNQLPDAVQQKKLDQDVEAARSRLIDWDVKLTLSMHKIESLRREVTELSGAVARRETLLAAAYPVLKTAEAGSEVSVRFANAAYTVGAFRQEIDELLTEQEADQAKLALERESLSRMVEQWRAGRRIVLNLKGRLDQTSHQIDQLRSRAVSARLESEALALVVGMNADGSSTAEVQRGVERLRAYVESAEAHNQARRKHGPRLERETSLERRVRRLQRLEAIRDQAESPARTRETAKDRAGDAVRATVPAVQGAAPTARATPAPRESSARAPW